MAARALATLASVFHATLLCAWLPVADGHGYITKPALRGGNEGNSLNNYCPHCLGDVVKPMPVCGKSQFLEYFDGPFEKLQAGEMFEVNIKITAHHMGHFELRLCDELITSDMDADAEGCLEQHVLRRARPEEVHSDCEPNDLRGDCQPFDEANPGYWYLPPKVGGGHQYYSFHYWLPANFTCEKCTLQWAWKTANSCTPHQDAYTCHFQNMKNSGWNVESWCSGVCDWRGECPAVQRPPVPCGEEFANCADLAIVDEGSQGPPQSQPAPAPEHTESPQPESEPEPEPEATPAPPVPAATPLPPAPSGASCVMNPDCSTNAWCADETYRTWCPRHSTNQCPTPQCMVGSSSISEPQPEGEPEPEPEPAPTPAPAANSMTCKAAPGLNRGVTDAACAKCATGYKWWPCNDAVLCECTGAALMQSSAEAQPIKQHGRKAQHVRSAFLSRDHGMIQLPVANMTAATCQFQ